MANKPEIKKERTHGGKEEEKREKQNKNIFWKERGGKKCQRATGQRLDTRNPCTRYNPFSRQRHGRATDAHELPHTKKEWAVSLNIETTTPFTRTSLMNDITRETKAQAKRKNSEWQEPVTSPTPNPNPGKPRNRLSIELERTKHVHFYIWWNKQG